MLDAKKDTGLCGSWNKLEQILVYQYGAWLKISYIFFTLLNYYYKNNISRKIRSTELFDFQSLKNILMRSCLHELNFIFMLEIAIIFPNHDIFNDDIIVGQHQRWENLFAQVGKKEFKHLLLWPNIYIC